MSPVDVRVKGHVHTSLRKLSIFEGKSMLSSIVSNVPGNARCESGTWVFPRRCKSRAVPKKKRKKNKTNRKSEYTRRLGDSHNQQPRSFLSAVWYSRI